MRDKDIDLTDVPQLGAAFFKRTVLWPGTEKQITLRLDPDVLEFFRHKGPRYAEGRGARAHLAAKRPRRVIR